MQSFRADLNIWGVCVCEKLSTNDCAQNASWARASSGRAGEGADLTKGSN